MSVLNEKLRLDVPQARIWISNQTPDGWQVTITRVGIQFTYRGGRTSDVVDFPMLRANQSQWYRSDPDCVTSHHVILICEVDGQEQMQEKTYPTPAGNCLIENKVVLAPTPFISEDEFFSDAGPKKKLVIS